MNFTNPYPHTEHEVYSQTFLQTVSANIRFSSSDTQAEYWQNLHILSRQRLLPAEEKADHAVYVCRKSS